MIKPSEAPRTHVFDETKLSQCEADFDAAIKKAHTTGHWPALVLESRDGMPIPVIEEMAYRYAKLGWHVYVTGREIPGVRATIDHLEKSTGIVGPGIGSR